MLTDDIITFIAERVYEEHELLVENLMLWTRDSPNTLLFHERPEKYQLFHNPEKYLLSNDDLGCDYDSHSRAMLLEEFFSHSHVPEISGPLYLKTDSRKCWKRFVEHCEHFFLHLQISFFSGIILCYALPVSITTLKRNQSL